jgi:hypothetical protein
LRQSKASDLSLRFKWRLLRGAGFRPSPLALRPSLFALRPSPFAMDFLKQLKQKWKEFEQQETIQIKNLKRNFIKWRKLMKHEVSKDLKSTQKSIQDRARKLLLHVDSHEIIVLFCATQTNVKSLAKVWKTKKILDGLEQWWKSAQPLPSLVAAAQS